MRIRRFVPLLVLAGLVVGSSASAGGLSIEDFYTALLEPNRAADGTIPAERQSAILAVATKILDENQMRELRARMARPTFTSQSLSKKPLAPALGEKGWGEGVGSSPGNDPLTPNPSPPEYSGRGAMRADSQPVSTDEPMATNAIPPDPCGTAPGMFTLSHPGLLDNLSVFAGLDGAKSPEDLGINANFGFRTHVNWAYPLLERRGIGVQAGTAINYSRTAVAVIESIDGTHDHTQSFTTVGVFQRSECGLSWGVVHDFLAENYYQHFDLGQVRAQVGYAVDSSNEVGFWGAKGDFGDHGSFAGLDVHLRPISQANLYWRRVWPNEAVTRTWVGIADRHDQFILVLPGHQRLRHPIVFGADLYVPLTDRLALFGEANFITPNDTGTVTATLGFAWQFGGTARAQARSRFAPLLPVANNPTFAVDLER
jgi:hypothetical protein